MKDIRTISIGGLTFDLFVFSDEMIANDSDGVPALHLPLGHKIRLRDVVDSAGGGAANTSVGLARLGCQSACCGVVGDDQWGSRLLQTLRTEGVDTQSITVVERESSSFSIILVSETGERVILYTSGTNAHLHDVTFDRSAAADRDWVYLNRVQEASCVIEDDLIALLASPAAPRLTWNPGGCHIDEGMAAGNTQTILKHTDLLLLNKEEALAFTHTHTVDAALRTLREAGTRIVCITDGKNGAVAVDATHRHDCPSPPCNVVDTTGAGDAFGTGMTWALSQGMDLPTALRAGTINAMSVVGAIGAQAGLLTQTEMQSRMAAMRFSVTSTPF